MEDKTVSILGVNHVVTSRTLRVIRVYVCGNQRTGDSVSDFRRLEQLSLLGCNSFFYSLDHSGPVVDDRGGQESEQSKMDDAKKEASVADGIRGPGELQMAPSVNHSQHDIGTGDELVSSVTLYRRRPRLLHGTVLPFLVVLYPSWLYVWLGVYGASDYPEAGLLALAAIGIAHVLTALSGYWSVHAHCWLTCSKVNTSNTTNNNMIIL